MQWIEAKDKIAEKIRPTTDINTCESTFRKVRETPLQNHQGYFVVPIGAVNTIRISWSMLKECFDQLMSDNGYSGQSFREKSPQEAKRHPCYVHVIGQIFVKAGIARQHTRYIYKRISS